MVRYALLCGSAPDGKIQKKIDSMYDSLLSENGGPYEENEIMIFPNGIDEVSLVYVLNNLRMSGIEQILLYICTASPVFDYEKTVWLGGNEIRKVIFEKPASLAGFLRGAGAASETADFSMRDVGGFSVQVVYDSDRTYMSGEDYFFDAALSPEFWGGTGAV